jgi:radical SAM protein with 4Fe4S-binding SPASM domain
MTNALAQCPLPFTQLYLHSTGDVSPCSFTQAIILGNVKQESLSEIWNGKKMQLFREQHLDGSSAICKANQQQYFCHLHHERLREQSNFLSHIPHPPIRLDFMLDSFCNLKCVMCTNVLEPRGGYDHEEFWIHCEKEVFPFVKEIEIIGGEPFLLPQTMRLVQSVHEKNPSCKWRITTNAAYSLGSKLIALADLMDFESLAISIDSLKEDVFAKIRAGGNLKQVLETTDDWIAYAQTRQSDRPIKLVANFVVQHDNAYELPAFLSFCRKKKLTPYPIVLVDPTAFSVFKWPVAQLEQLISYYLNDYIKGQEPTLRTVLLKLIKALPPLEQASYLADLREAL